MMGSAILPWCSFFSRPVCVWMSAASDALRPLCWGTQRAGDRSLRQRKATKRVVISSSSTIFSSFDPLHSDSTIKHQLLLFLDEHPITFLFHPACDIAHWSRLAWGMRRNHDGLLFQLGFAHRAAR